MPVAIVKRVLMPVAVVHVMLAARSGVCGGDAVGNGNASVGMLRGRPEGCGGGGFRIFGRLWAALKLFRAGSQGFGHGFGNGGGRVAVRIRRAPADAQGPCVRPVHFPVVFLLGPIAFPVTHAKLGWASGRARIRDPRRIIAAICAPGVAAALHCR